MTATLATVEDIEAVVSRALAQHLGTPRAALTVAEAAESLAVSPDTVRRLIAEGHLRTLPHMGRSVRVPVASVQEFVSGSTGGSAGSAPLSLLTDARGAGDRTDSTAGDGLHPSPAA